MKADRFRGGGETLGQLVASSRAEGWNFVAKLVAELEQGDFTKTRTALFGVYDRVCDGTLAGVCGLVPDPYLEPDLHVGRLRHLYVLPGYRCRGVATTLVQAVIDEARRHYRVLRLRTPNPDAARLYETLGFAAVTEPTATHALELP